MVYYNRVKEDHKQKGQKLKMNLNKHSKVRTVGLSSSLALLALLGLAVFCPSAYDSSANAADVTENKTFEIDFILQKTASATFTIDFLLAQQLSISLSDNINTPSVTVQPVSSSAVTKTSQADFSVSTNSTAGLGVFVYADGDNNLKGTTNANNKIPSITANSTLTNMPVNHWGYALAEGTPNADTLTYAPVQASKGNALKSTSGVTDNKAYRLAFGTKVNMNQAPDTYSKTMNIQVIPNGSQTTAIGEAGDMLRTMQEQNTDHIETDSNILDIVAK